MLVNRGVIRVLATVVIPKFLRIRVLLVEINLSAKGVKDRAAGAINIEAAILVRLILMPLNVSIHPGNKVGTTLFVLSRR
jgi:hypothetical protein